MPLYGYQCRECGHEFERRETLRKHERSRPACPECKSRKVERVLGSFFAKTARKS